jgi:Tol biopolymer transport system component
MRGDGSGLREIRGIADDDVHSVALSADGRRLKYQTGAYGNFAFGGRRYLAYDGPSKRDDRNITVSFRTCGAYGYSEVAASRANETDPAFTADGVSFAFASDAEGGQLWSWKNALADPCRLMPGRPKLVTKTGSGTLADPDFSPSGGSLAYVGRSGRRLRLMTIGLDGRSRRVVGRGVAGRAPQWTRLP